MTAENRPVYSVPDYAQCSINANTRTYKDEDPFSILLPALDHLRVIFFCGFGAYEEERCRVAGFSLGWR